MKVLNQIRVLLLCVIACGCATPTRVNSREVVDKGILRKAESYLDSVSICLDWLARLGITRERLVLDLALTNEENLTRKNPDEFTVFFRIKGTEKPGGYYEIFVLHLKANGNFWGCGHGSVGPVSSIDN